jgi:hypothetical protein
MKTNKLIAATLAAAMAMAAVPTASHAVIVRTPGPTFGGTGVGPWPIFACAGGIILAAFAANARDNRELTAPEAWSCGLMFWFSEPGKHKKKH